MHKTFIIGSTFNVPLHPKTAILGPLRIILITCIPHCVTLLYTIIYWLCSQFAFISLLQCCFTSTETVGLLGTGTQDVHLDFHTAPEL